MKQIIRLTETQLHNVIKESVKRVLQESSNYGITMEDTLAWVQNKQPQMNPQEQIKFALNILKKTALNTKNHWGPMGTILPNGKLLSIWDSESLAGTQYGRVAIDFVYLNGKKIGSIKYFTPLVITRNVEPYFEEIKDFNKLIAEKAQDGMDFEGREYDVED